MANTLRFTNFASAAIATATVNPGDTTFALSAGQGAMFPSTVGADYFYVVLADSLTAPTKREVIRVTVRTGDTFTTVERGRDGTIAQTWVAGNYVELRLCNAVLSDNTWMGAAGVLLTSNNLSDVQSAASSRTNLGLGSAAVLPSTTWLTVANNLSDLANAATARTNLGLGTIAVENTPLAVAKGGTGVASSTGTVNVVLSNSPTLVTPTLGVASATSVNKVAITAPAAGATLTLADGSTLQTIGAFVAAMTFTGATAVTFPLAGTLATLAGAETFTNKTYTLGTAKRHVLADAAGNLVVAAAATDGQLLIGGTGLVPALAALTAGANITITNAANAITIAAASIGPTFADNVFRVFDDGDVTKILALQCSGITTGTTRTLTVPDASDTIAVLAAAQTLTNKTITIQDTLLTIFDNADATKQMRFDAGGIGAGVTRTFSFPNVDDTVVTLTAGQTLTNKTLTSPTINTPTIASATHTGTSAFPASGEWRSTGELGVLSGALTDRAIAIGMPTGVGATLFGSVFNSTVPSTVTGSMYGHYVGFATAAAAFTVVDLQFYYANALVKGAGSAVTSVYGFRAANAIAQGTNNYGFYSDIVNAAATWQLYMAGTAQSYFGGPVGILTSGPLAAGALIYLAGTTAHAATTTNLYGVASQYSVPSTATGTSVGYYSWMQTVASAFTAGAIIHFDANTTGKGAGSSITTVYGFYARNGIANGSTNYGFYSDIARATTTWQLYAGGTADSYFGGQIGVLSNAPGINIVAINGTHPNAGTTIYSLSSLVTIPATATANAINFRSELTTAASAFTLGTLAHYQATATTKGAGSAITNVYGFWASGSIVNDVAASTTYGFYSGLNKGVNATVWAFYNGGTAPVRLGDGSADSVRIAGTLPSGNSIIYYRDPGDAASGDGAGTVRIFQGFGRCAASVTNEFSGLMLDLAQASSVTLNNLFGVRISLSKGAGATINNAYAFYAAGTLPAVAARGAGFYSDINSGTNLYGLYMGGTADNLFAGRLLMSGSKARIEEAQGAAVASANNLVLGDDGNSFQISGTTQINLIDNTNWQGGSVVILKFQGGLTVKHNQAASGNNKPIMLIGAVDFVATADDQLALRYDSTDAKWIELSAAVI